MTPKGPEILWEKIRQQVKQADQTISEDIFMDLVDLFGQEYAQGQHSPGELTVEWGKDEFLRVVDLEGKDVLPTSAMVSRLEKETFQSSLFSLWFRLDGIQKGVHQGQRVILPGRWLCHLVGFRHRTVEILIDPPGMPGFTLVQVRGLEKYQAPGCFDIPCAGHVSGVEGLEDALRKELREELNLSPEDLAGLSRVACFPSGLKEPAHASLDYEYRVLYRASLKSESLGKIRFTDGEVAGLGIFSVPELRILVSRFPERVASGLEDAIIHYE